MQRFSTGLNFSERKLAKEETRLRNEEAVKARKMQLAEKSRAFAVQREAEMAAEAAVKAARLRERNRAQVARKVAERAALAAERAALKAETAAVAAEKAAAVAALRFRQYQEAEYNSHSDSDNRRDTEDRLNFFNQPEFFYED